MLSAPIGCGGVTPESPPPILAPSLDFDFDSFVFLPLAPSFWAVEEIRVMTESSPFRWDFHSLCQVNVSPKQKRRTSFSCFPARVKQRQNSRNTTQHHTTTTLRS
jgi:hypothetical protein